MMSLFSVALELPAGMDSSAIVMVARARNKPEVKTLVRQTLEAQIFSQLNRLVASVKLRPPSRENRRLLKTLRTILEQFDVEWLRANHRKMLSVQVRLSSENLAEIGVRLYDQGRTVASWLKTATIEKVPDDWPLIAVL